MIKRAGKNGLDFEREYKRIWGLCDTFLLDGERCAVPRWYVSTCGAGSKYSSALNLQKWRQVLLEEETQVGVQRG